MASVIDNLKVILGLETKGFPTAQSNIKSFVEGTERQFEHLKTAVAAYFTVGFAKELVKFGTELAVSYKDMAEQSGETIKEVQKISQAARNVGKEFGNAARGFDQFLQFAEEARTGNTAEKLNLLERYGLGMKDLNALKDGTMTARQAIEKMFAAGASAENPNARRDMAQIFGVKGVGGMIAIMNELKTLGPIKIIEDEQVKRLDEAAKAMERVKRAVALTAAEQAAGLIGAIDRLYLRSQIIDKAKERLRSGELRPDQQRGAQMILDKLSWGRTSDTPTMLKLLKLVDSLYPERPGETPGAPSRASMFREAGGDIPEGLIKRRSDAERGMNDAVREAFLSVSNPAQKRAALPQEIRQLMADADELEKKTKGTKDEDPAAVAALRKKAIGKAVELAQLSQTGENRISPDSAASIGGYIGGAAIGNDPGLIVQQDIRSILASSLLALTNLPPVLRQAIIDGMSGKPIDGMK